MISKQWKRKRKRVDFKVVEAEAEAASFKKLEAEAPEAVIFQGSGSCKLEINGSGSRSIEKILEAEAEAASLKKLEAEALHAEAEALNNSPLPHHWLQP